MSNSYRARRAWMSVCLVPSAILQVEKWRILMSKPFASNSVSNWEKLLRRLFRCCNRLMERIVGAVRNATSCTSVSNRAESPSKTTPNLDGLPRQWTTITKRSPISGGRGDRRKYDKGPSRHAAKHVPGSVPELEETSGAVYQERRGVLWIRHVWLSCKWRNKFKKVQFVYGLPSYMSDWRTDRRMDNLDEANRR